MHLTLSDALQHTWRPLRPVSAGSDAPWPGMLVRLASGDLGTVVDAHVLTPQWWGWDAAPAEHVVTATDAARRLDGHDVLLPAFASRLADALARTRSARAPLAPGEAVTVAVGLVRGIATLKDDRLARCGEWWLTADGCPVLATDVGGTPVVDATTAVLDALRGALGEAMTGRIGQWLARPRATELDVLEDDLFRVASPAALSTDGSAASPGVEIDDDRSMCGPAPVSTPPGSWTQQLARHVDVDLADLVSRATTGVWRRLRVARGGAGRRPVIAAGVVGVAILVGGVLWPTGTPAVAEGEASTRSAQSAPLAPNAGAPGDGDHDAAPVADPAPTEPPLDFEVVAAELLTARTRCEGEPTCLAGVMVEPDRSIPPGVVDADAALRTVTLLDEFGDIAVLRVQTDGLGAQVVVIQAGEQGWLLRDVYDAQEPG